MNRDEALCIAIEAHEGQKDKSGKPYILHPMAVAERVAYAGEVYEVVAFLHDVLEDTAWTIDDLDLDPHQLQGLMALTQNEDEPYFDYIERCASDPFGLLIKMADIDHNLSPERQAKLPEQTRRSLEGQYKKAVRMISESAGFVYVNLHNSERPEYAWYVALVERCCG